MSDHILQQVKGRQIYAVQSNSIITEEIEDETLDPRIQVELEKLNKASADINKIELELDDARSSFRLVLSDSILKLNALAKKLGYCVDKARPYYEARHRATEVHLETHKATLRYERACSMHEAAKEMVQLAEQGYQRRDQDADPAWQEMLNHATMKVNEAETERMDSEAEHQRTMIAFKDSESRVLNLQKELKRAITKSRPYFEMKARFNQLMEDLKYRVSRLEEDVTSSKSLYSQALLSLEAISDDIHKHRLEKQRQLQLGVRGAGVGSESPTPPLQGQMRIDGRVTQYRSMCYDRNLDLSMKTQFHSSNSSSTISGDKKSSNNSSIINKHQSGKNVYTHKTIEPTIFLPSTDPIQIGDFCDHFEDSSYGDEYLSLPSKRNSMPNTSSRNELSYRKQSIEMYVPKETQCHDSSGASNVICSSLIHKNNSPESLNVPGEIPNSNSKSRNKLQGLILRVNPDNEAVSDDSHVLTADEQSNGIKNFSEKETSADKIQHLFPHKSTPIVEGTAKFATKQVSPDINEDINKERNRLDVLKLPEPVELIDDNSDAESVASTGPMLDDEQIEYLTMDFTENSDMKTLDLNTRKTDWSRNSLPLKLHYLEPYIDKNACKLPKSSLYKDYVANDMKNID